MSLFSLVLIGVLAACGDKGAGSGDDTSGSNDGGTTDGGTTGDGGTTTDGGGSDGGTTDGGGSDGGGSDGGGSDGGGGGDTGSGPASPGFDFDGAWYPLGDGATSCQPTSEGYVVRGAALRDDGTNTPGGADANFAAVPTPGSFTVGPFSSGESVEAGHVALMFTDLRDTSTWTSDGSTGTLQVSDAGSGAIDVIWHDVGVSDGAGGSRFSAVGWMRCTP